MKVLEKDPVPNTRTRLLSAKVDTKPTLVNKDWSFRRDEY
jgi:hypothetical protein